MTSDPIRHDSPPVPPPAEGARLDWKTVPASVRAALEAEFGSAVVDAASQPTGFSPGVAARLQLANGRRVFVKAASATPNAETPRMHRREAQIVSALPPHGAHGSPMPVPRLLWWLDDADTGWVVLVYEAVEGAHPAQPWQMDELNRVLSSLDVLAEALTPSPLPASFVGTASDAFAHRMRGYQQLANAPSDGLDAWSLRHLEQLAALEASASAAVEGDSLIHFDIRADNLLLTPERVWLVDWPLACVGAAWVDVAFFAPSVQMQGGPSPEYLIAHHAASRRADPDRITAAAVSIAGFFSWNALQPPPPGLPTLRAFQAAQGAIARQWVATRTDWT